MDNYEDKSDFFINNAVASALGLVSPTEYDSKSAVIWVHNGNPMRGAHHVDYCNNPADAWPIITDNKIETSWAFDDMWKAVITNQGQPGAFRRIKHHDDNPLRAAMIVFLKMQEQG